MNVRKRLFSQRRWMLWLPMPAAALMAAPGQFADYIHLLIGGLIFWIPFWLAWWLSDGFRTVRLGVPGGRSSTGGNADGGDVFVNYADGHLQNYQGPSSYRL